MRLIAVSVGIALVFTTATGIAQAQNRPVTIDGLFSSAKIAAGLEWPGTFLRLCVPPALPGSGGAIRSMIDS